MTRDEAFIILGCALGSGQADIKSAYRKLVLIHHPDKGGSPQKFMRLTEAYDLLLSGKPDSAKPQPQPQQQRPNPNYNDFNRNIKSFWNTINGFEFRIKVNAYGDILNEPVRFIFNNIAVGHNFNVILETGTRLPYDAHYDHRGNRYHFIFQNITQFQAASDQEKMWNENLNQRMREHEEMLKRKKQEYDDRMWEEMDNNNKSYTEEAMDKAKKPGIFKRALNGAKTMFRNLRD